MINIQTKKHDRFSVEFKVGFKATNQSGTNEFTMNTWIFIPDRLDINSSTYSKNQFYRDLHSHIRLITPTFLLREIAQGEALPMTYLERAFIKMANDPTHKNITEYEYHIKMFAAIFKSSLRDHIYYIIKPLADEKRCELCDELVNNLRSILGRYRALSKIISVPTVSSEVFGYYQFGDEFISNILQRQVFRLLDFLKTSLPETYLLHKQKFIDLIKEEIAYRSKMGYSVVEKHNSNRNRDLVSRAGALKKYAESELFLTADKKKDGVLIEQIYYSIAAGASMIFATAISFSFQQRYGNFTMPLFVALVVSYMLKDRIKELIRYYFAHKKSRRFFDNVTTVSINDHVLGWSKEGVDFIMQKRVPREVMNIRDRTPLLESENRNSIEKIILYRKLVQLDRKVLNDNSQYYISGINDIFRFNLSSFLLKTDDPEVPLFILSEEDDYEEISGSKVYYLNFVIQLKFGETEEYKRYRVIFNRTGIKEVEELNSSSTFSS
ncbi:MAG: hypothetical protein WCX48_05545 [Bacteroidales bacterium]